MSIFKLFKFKHSLKSFKQGKEYTTRWCGVQSRKQLFFAWISPYLPHSL